MSYDLTIAKAMQFAPPGHFYSPHPLIEDVETGHEAVCHSYEPPDGISLNVEEQLKLLQAACAHEPVGPWNSTRSGKWRYYYQNDFFRFGDANAVWHVAKLFRPKRVIEVGSGFSTACWLDCFDSLDLRSELHCIEPYPDRLRDLCLADMSSGRAMLWQRPVQEVPLAFFDQLQKDDVLFVDSTHVSKSGSDVNHLFFRVLPRLASGVIVHFHDIFWPFEYPKAWYLEGRSWNECFLLRAFLQFNSAFRMMRFNSYLAAMHPSSISAMDSRFVSESGGSIWLVKQ